jgi:sulfur-carrier protein
MIASMKRSSGDRELRSHDAAGRRNDLRRGLDGGGSVAMVTVELTRHLYDFFPDLQGKKIAVEASTLAEVVREVEAMAPGFAFYVCDERGSLRRHVNIFVEEELLADRAGLSDRVKPGSRVFIMQALSGG